MRAFLDALYRASGWAAALFLVLICAVVTAQVALNAVDKVVAAFGGLPLGLTVPSYSDFTGFFLAAASFLALAPTLRAGGHIRVGLLVDRLPARPRRLVEVACLAAAGGTTLYAVRYVGGLAVESWHYGDLSSGLVPVPLWIPQAAMLAGLVVLAVAFVDDLVAVLSGRAPSYAARPADDISGEL